MTSYFTAHECPNCHREAAYADMPGYPLCLACDEQASTIPHCLACDDNPAAEDSDLCLPCAQLRDAQSVRQENAEPPFPGRRGGVLSGPRYRVLGRPARGNPRNPFGAADGPLGHHIVVKTHSEDGDLTKGYDVIASFIGGAIGEIEFDNAQIRKAHALADCLNDGTCDPPQDDDTGDNRGGCSYRMDDLDRAAFASMDDGYRKQAFFARASAFSLALTMALGIGSASAAETLTYTSPTTGRTLTLPFIGTEQYSDSCTITKAWEDGSALAYCAEDGASYVYDSDGQYVPNIPENPVREPGWYVWEGGAS